MNTNSPAADGLVFLATDLSNPKSIIFSACSDIIQDVAKKIIQVVEGVENMNNFPSGVNFNNQFYCFYENSGSLYYNTYIGGSTWSSQSVPIPNVTLSCSPSAVEFTVNAVATLFVFYQSSSGNGELLYITSTDAVNWSQPTQVPACGLSASPSAVVFPVSGNQTLYIFYQGEGNAKEVYYSTSTDGVHWSQSIFLSTGLDCAASPSATVLNNVLYCFANPAAEGSNAALVYATSSNGSTWSGNNTVPGANISGSVSATTFEGKIYVFHEGADFNGQLWCSIFDGTNWSPDAQINNLSVTENTSMAVYNGQLYCFTQDYNNTGVVSYSVFIDEVWSWATRLNKVSMSNTPSAVVFSPNNTLYLFYKGPGNNLGLYYSILSGEGGWSESQSYAAGTNAQMWDSPSAIQYGNSIYIFHQGRSEDGELWYSIWNPSQGGGGWSQDKNVPNIGMSYSPCPVVWDNNIYVFVSGSGYSSQMWYTWSSDGGSSWQGNVPANGVNMSYAPAAVVYTVNGSQTLYIFYQGGSNDGALWYVTSTNPSNSQGWSSPIKIPGVSIAQSPSVAVVNGSSGSQIYVSYQGAGANSGQFYYITSSDGHTWSGPTQVTSPNPQFSGSPVAAIALIPDALAVPFLQ